MEVQHIQRIAAAVIQLASNQASQSSKQPELAVISDPILFMDERGV